MQFIYVFKVLVTVYALIVYNMLLLTTTDYLGSIQLLHTTKYTCKTKGILLQNV